MKKVLVISGVNLFEGGTLSILKDCLEYVNSSDFNNYRVIALIHKKEVVDTLKYNKIEFIEFQHSRKSYFFRLYYEFFHFKNLSKKYKVDFWLSLHDISPNVGNIPQAVYCHNPAPFDSFNLSDLFMQPAHFFFSLFYKYLYRININKNRYVIVQQLWIKENFEKMFSINPAKIIVAIPQVPQVPVKFVTKSENKNSTNFFFPTFPRPFKNIEIIGEAVYYLSTLGIVNFNVIITVDGTENMYAKKIVKKYSSLLNIKFIGLISRERVYQHYSETDCLIFPSKLETWGLPISEFKQFGKPMLVSDLPYAKETVGVYDKVRFFNPTNAIDLADKMRDYIESRSVVYDETNITKYPDPFVNSWSELFNKLLS
jgi:glycosyltransferase involved in cell wall biosynthesis